MSNLQQVEFSPSHDASYYFWDTEVVTEWMDIETEYLWSSLDDYWWWREFANQDEGDDSEADEDEPDF
jgi:hypothetical protein